MYILECNDGSYYVGSTTDMERRLWEHNQGEGSKYTARCRPVKLVFAAEFASIAEAFAAEKRVQGWRREKREALIRGDYEALPELARKKWPSHRPATLVE
ncbi:MAG: GIY-YIG nuclease family protein [Chloroflexi bacterium]|nr:GIY-YIG nuclease family protein [Chloroflexota bacterium]